MSTVTLAQVRAWQPDRLGTAAAGVSRAATSVEQAADGTRSTMEDLQSTWDGDAAGAAADRAAEERRTGLALADALEQARGILDRGASDVGRARQRVLDVVADAEAEGFTVSNAGEVTPPTLPPVVSSPEGAAAAVEQRNGQQRQLNAQAQNLADDLSRALTAAAEADSSVASSLSGVSFPESLDSAAAAYLERLVTSGDPLGALGAVGAGGVALALSLKNLAKTGTKAKNLVDFFRASSAPITDYDAFVKNLRNADAALDTLRNGPANGGLMRFVSGSKAAKLAGRAFLPLTVLTGGIDAVTGGGYDGARGWGTRAAGAAGAVGAGALVASSAGLIALGPVGLGIAGAAVVGYGLWSAGNYVYDNWDDITEFTGRAADWVGDRAGDAYGAVSEAAGDAKDWAADRLEEAGETVGDAVDGATDLGKKALSTASFGLFG